MLPGAAVTLRGGDVPRTVYTDAEGAFELQLASFGDTVVVRFSG